MTENKNKVVLFTNWTGEDFIGYWDGKGKKISAGESKHMPDWLARHFAIGLTNRELLRVVNGKPVYEGGERSTSPKFPEQVPLFMDLYNKAYNDTVTSEELGDSTKDDLDTLVESVNKNRSSDNKSSNQGGAVKASNPMDSKEPQVVLAPDLNDEDDEESSFKGKPK